MKPIEPVFLDYKKDMQQFNAKSAVPVLYKQNVNNDLFELVYLFDMGNNNDKALGLAFKYMEYLGTSKLTPEQLKSEFYRLACTFQVYSSDERIYVQLRGLNENMSKAVSLFEKLLADAQVNKEAYANLANDRSRLSVIEQTNSCSKVFSILFLIRYTTYNSVTDIKI